MADARKPRQGLPRKPGAAPAEAPMPRRGLPRKPGVTPPARPAPPAAEAEGDAPAPAPTRGPTGSRRRAVAIAALALAGAAIVVLATRWFLDLGFMREFLAAHPGQYRLPAAAPVGLPAWLAWTHFFSAFLLVLIVRTGLRVRHEARPPAVWAPRWNRERKISLTAWLHQALDLLWIVNGVVFAVLLFATGQWMRIVPTSWEVFPNALAVALRYVALEWPSENGWVNYNSLQQLAYFVTVFVAAPLAVLTGLRLGGLWPKRATTLNRIYPTQLARAIHFRVMLYFVAFVVVHVTLVLATGPLRNLDHMFAARGSTDPAAYATDWTGLVLFLAAVAVTVAALVASARPLLIAPLAARFGRVTGR